MELHFIFNPLANNGKSGHAMNRIEKYLNKNNIKYCLHATQYPEHATDIAHTLTYNKNRKVHIISVGGDGTANEILNGIRNFDNVVFSIIPTGSGNDFSKNFDVDYDDHVGTIERQIKNRNKWHYIDFISVNNDKIRALNVLGCGIDSDILECYNSKKWFSPRYRYKMATIQKCLNFSIHDIDFKKDSNKGFIHRQTLIFCVCNGTRIGGGIKCSNHARVDDGYLTCTYIRKFERVRLIPYMQRMLKYGIDKVKTANKFNCKKICLKLQRPLYEVDGQLKKDTNILKINIVSKKLKFVA